MWRNPWSSFEEGGQILRSSGITLNASFCVYACVTFGTAGWSIGGFTAGRGSGLRRGFGVAVYGTIGTPPSSSLSAMGCYVVCGGAYKNLRGSGGGGQFGVGTPGVFLGGSVPLPG